MDMAQASATAVQLTTVTREKSGEENCDLGILIAETAAYGAPLEHPGEADTSGGILENRPIALGVLIKNLMQITSNDTDVNNSYIFRGRAIIRLRAFGTTLTLQQATPWRPPSGERLENSGPYRHSARQRPAMGSGVRRNLQAGCALV